MIKCFKKNYGLKLDSNLGLRFKTQKGDFGCRKAS